VSTPQKPPEAAIGRRLVRPATLSEAKASVQNKLPRPSPGRVSFSSLLVVRFLNDPGRTAIPGLCRLIAR
jgi:hypothetical protein